MGKLMTIRDITSQLCRGNRAGHSKSSTSCLRPACLLLAATAVTWLSPSEALSQVLTSQTLALSADHATPLFRVQSSDPQRAYIMDIQRHLQTLGLYRSTIDGVAGLGTWRAIEQFYRMAGIAGDRRFEAQEFALLSTAAQLHRSESMTPSDAVRQAGRAMAEARTADQRSIDLWGAGRFGEAERELRLVVDFNFRFLGPEHPDTLRSSNNLASAIDAQGRHAEAEALHRETLASSERVLGPEHPDTLRSSNNLASAIRAQGRHAEAEAIFRETLAIRERVLGPEHPDTLVSRNNLAYTRWSLGRIDDALATIEDGFVNLPSAFATTGRVSLNLGAYLEWAWTVANVPPEQLAARTFPAQGYLTYGDLDVALGDMAARQQVGDPTTADVLREFQDAREDVQRLRRAYLASFEADRSVTEAARMQIQSDMRAAVARFSEVAARIDRDFPALAELELPRALSAQEAQALLEPGEGLLAYVSTEDHLYAWLATQDGLVWHRMDVSRAELSERVSHLRASLDLGADAAVAPPAQGCALISSNLPERPFDLCAARALQEIVVGEIDLSGIDELIVVPDGPLRSLPFAMLITDHVPGTSWRWLIEDHAITTLPTTSSLRALRHGGATTGNADRLPFLGIAPVEFEATHPESALRGTPLAALPGTADEVRLLSGLLGAGRDGTVIGAEASEAFVKSASLDRYSVLSFATHALLSHEAGEVTGGRIREMALALRPGEGEDGFLTATEVAGLRLDAEWVLLSACNTAGGEGDDAQGLSGLARAFFFSGVRALMVSHWPIDDAVTPGLMADTMQRSRTSGGIGRAQALRQAQLAMLSQRHTEHPFYWAPFSVVGENR